MRAGDGATSGLAQPGTMTVFARQRCEAVRRLQDEPRLCPNAALAGRDDEELVPGVGEVAAVESEHLARDREVERQRALVDDCRHGVYVRKIAKVV